MILRLTQLLTGLLCLTSPQVLGLALTTRQTRAPGFQFGNDSLRGVNVGGWLVLEPWITPSLFESKPDWVVDEWTYGQYMRTQNDTMSEIRQHWATWFSFSELEDMAAVGLNTVRIQIGYWSIIPLDTNEPYLVGAYPYLKIAVDWAQSLNLKVMIDLHGAPGSQNGFDNSGLRTTRQWFTNQTNADRTISALTTLTSDFTQASLNGTVIAIELINEPFPQTDAERDFLPQFYLRAYSAVRAASSWSGVVVALDEAFQGLGVWEGFMGAPGWYDVAMDTHIYSMFDLSLISQGDTANLEWHCSQQDYLRQSNQYHWTIVGEWTVAHTDCAKWLNGRGLGARYDNSLVTAAPAEYVDYLGRSFETQTWVYEQASGWIMWTWKTEQASEWSFSAGITNGWIPTPITAKPHGQPCQNSSAASSTRSNSSKWRRKGVIARGAIIPMGLGWFVVAILYRYYL